MCLADDGRNDDQTFACVEMCQQSTTPDVSLQCIEKMGKGCLNDQQVAELVRILDSILKEHDKRQVDRHGEFLENCFFPKKRRNI